MVKRNYQYEKRQKELAKKKKKEDKRLRKLEKKETRVIAEDEPVDKDDPRPSTLGNGEYPPKDQ